MGCLVATLSLATPTFAHPHVFVDTAIEVLFDDQGRASALQIRWRYDDLFSLLIVEERGLDPDFDGQLTPDETLALQGFDMNWDAGFAGDTYALQSGQPLTLLGPADWTAAYTDGRLQSTHVRRFAEPVAAKADPLVVQAYDPGFYTAYAMDVVPVLTGNPACTAQVFEPDRAAADAILLAAIDEQAGSTDIEGEFPAIGAAYAEEVRITCAPPF